MPRRENCRFFGHAAQAESAGFRPCLRCRPELAPHSRASGRSRTRATSWRSRRRACSTSPRPGATSSPSRRAAGQAAGRERPPPAPHLRSPVRRLARAVPADAPAAHRQAIAGRHRPADHAGRAGQRLRQRAPLQRRIPRALRPQPDPAAPRGRGAAGRKAWRSAWAIGRPTTCRPCSASSRKRELSGVEFVSHRAARLRWAARLSDADRRQAPRRLAAGGVRRGAPPGGAAGQRLAARSAAARDPPPARGARPGRRPARDQQRAARKLPAGRRPARARRDERLRTGRARGARPADHGGRGAHAGAAPGGPLRRDRSPRRIRSSRGCFRGPPCWRKPRAMRWASWASCKQRQAAIVAHRAGRGREAGAAARRRRRPGHDRSAEAIARHRRLDGAVHRDARPALARRVSGRRRGAAQGAGRAGRPQPGARGASRVASVEALAQLCRGAGLARDAHFPRSPHEIRHFHRPGTLTRAPWAP